MLCELLVKCPIFLLFSHVFSYFSLFFVFKFRIFLLFWAYMLLDTLNTTRVSRTRTWKKPDRSAVWWTHSLSSRLRLTGIVLLPTLTSEISWPVQRLTMLSMLITLELLERRYWQERQLVITLLRGVSKLSLLLQSLLSGLKATTCTYIRNSCCSGLLLVTAAPMTWRFVSLCNYTTAQFDFTLMLRKPQKPPLPDALRAKLSPDATLIPDGDVQHVF